MTKCVMYIEYTMICGSGSVFMVGTATLHRTTLNRATVNRRQFIARQLIAATINRSDS